MNSSDRLRYAILADPSAANLLSLARTFKSEGQTQQEITVLFDVFRAAHERDADENTYDNILDTMDMITGWCTPNRALFPPDAQ